jgi:hypothetical protein
MAQRTPEIPEAAKGRCPICREPSTADDRPFCSRRCANIDLYRWLSNGYAIPGRSGEDEDGEAAAGSAGSTIPKGTISHEDRES